MGRLKGAILEATKIAFVPTKIDLLPLAHKHTVDLYALRDFECETISRDRVDFFFTFHGKTCRIACRVDASGDSFWDIVEGDDALTEWAVCDFCVEIAEQLLLD